MMSETISVQSEKPIVMLTLIVHVYSVVPGGGAFVKYGGL